MTGGGGVRADLRAELRDGRGMLATFSLLGCAEVIELVALAGFDAVILDMEHGPFDLQQMSRCLVAAHLRGMPVITRVANGDPSMIGKVLDLGADGVLAPHIGSAAEARALVAAARFAPEGERGAHPWVRAADFDGASGGSAAGWFADANSRAAVLAMVEGADALHNLEEIVHVTGLDAVFLGPVDLAQALGVPGQPDHELVVSALTRARAVAAEAGLATAVFAASPERARSWLDKGLGLVAYGVDSKLILDGLRSARDRGRP
ncbi:HpcH/HpaI aldolase family protein [Pseudonocardia acaciae]|uniref:HpcH/HpaI aldolase family protein n=1 Tax=Pseudonocardia acaciae TaxID=551276 RepID=UPI0006850437|nr:aldolase/citrate lyase family protein [Pseudonocardia acaciae]